MWNERIVSVIKLSVVLLVAGFIALALAASPVGTIRAGQNVTFGPSEAYAAEGDALAAAGSKAGLTDQGAAVSTMATKISLKSKVSVVKGVTYTIKLTGNKSKKVKWTSSNSKVAKVVKGTKTNVTIKAMKVGKATITAKVGGKKYKCTVNVIGTLGQKWIAVPMLDTKKLTLKHAKVKSWKSADPSIVKVNKKGVLTPGMKKGETYVVCTDTLGNKYKCDVSVITPNIFCMMKETVYSDALSTRTYFKRFFLFNGSATTVVFNDSLMAYYPYYGDGDYDTFEPLVATDGEGWGDPLDDDHKFVLAPNDSKYFYAFEGDDYYSIREGGVVGARLTINGKLYACLFKLGGTLDGNMISFTLA